jgi:hypothetical protein
LHTHPHHHHHNANTTSEPTSTSTPLETSESDSNAGVVIGGEGHQAVFAYSEIERILAKEEFQVNFTDLKRNVDTIDPAQVSVAIPNSGLKYNLGSSHASGNHSSANGATPLSSRSRSTFGVHERGLPSGAQGSITAGGRETADQQEGATGSGRGQHEDQLSPSLVQGQEDPNHLGVPPYDHSQHSHSGLLTPREREESDRESRHRLQDELGRVPDINPGLKPEVEPPASHHDIVLEPRLVRTLVCVRAKLWSYILYVCR